ncbi:methyltransferase domain-containing protein [Parasedimentitalea maritima]|uniref:Methyltransferase domain-containing protein n=1 Tax=Parasedimentitalea maritima TaxID=2578117 RepID=A0A6A4RJV9_9RHOB|nr:methyltransferase domain-containing protein [Zongyanglinia marina]KAE9630895.1 methyltransferase domain-containing protein [Zongyanglinia marina]
MTQASQTPPTLFDRQALRFHRDRHKRAALFLHEMARDEVEDRLSMVNRTFTDPAIVTPFAEIWQNSFPNAKIVADEDLITLQPDTHDVVVHAMCLHWANDPVGQLIQCRRALKEDGLLLVLMLGGQTLHQLRSVLAEAETTITGGLSPRVAPMGEIRDLGALLQRAGLNLPVADLIPLTAEYRDLFHLMHDLRDMAETNALAHRQKHPSSRLLFDMADHLYRQHFANDQGRLPATFEMVCLTGWSPSETQQKPLRPGSARSRLADALKVPETRLPE